MSIPATAGGAPQPAGAIHDIGYRSYTGPRLGRAYVWGTLFADTLRGAYGIGRSARSKIMPWLLLGLVCLPPIIIAVIAANIGDAGYVTPAAYVGLIGQAVYLFAAAQTPQAVSRDLRFRTVSLYFSRPMRRWEYVTARSTGMVTALFLFLALPVTLLFLGGLLAELPWRDLLPDWGRGLLVAAVSAVVFETLALAIAALTPRRGVAIALIVVAFFVTSNVATVSAVILFASGYESTAAYALLLAPEGVVLALQSWLDSVSAVGQIPVSDTQGVVAIVAGLVWVGLGAAILALRYRKVGVA